MEFPKYLALHNLIAEEREGLAGLRLVRFPKRVRDRLWWGGPGVAGMAVGGEIRLVCATPHLKVTLSSLDQDGEVHVFRGELHLAKLLIAAGTTREFRLDHPQGLREDMAPKLTRGFHPNVWRLVLTNFSAVFHGMDTWGKDCRPPQKGETPATRWLAYGSSITHGDGLTTYVPQTARRLGVDVHNCGMSGSCLVEQDMADFLIGRNDWEFATLELGVNMRGAFSVEDFAKRTTYLVDGLTKKHPGKPVVLITIFPNNSHHLAEAGKESETQRGYDEHLREMAREFAAEGRNVHVVEGSEVLRDFGGLTCDLVHPSMYGHTQMAENLAAKLRPILKAAGLAAF